MGKLTRLGKRPHSPDPRDPRPEDEARVTSLFAGMNMFDCNRSASVSPESPKQPTAIKRTRSSEDLLSRTDPNPHVQYAKSEKRMHAPFWNSFYSKRAEIAQYYAHEENRTGQIVSQK